MKKLLFSFCIILLSLTVILSCGGDKNKGKTVLTMGSWRTGDAKQIQALLDEYSKIKGGKIAIEFKPINPPDYNATLRLQLDGGTGPDLMYARSYATGIELFNAGFFADISDLKGLKENFSDSALEAWSTGDGRNFGVPFMAVSHGVYYNIELLEKVGYTEFPKTWEDFLVLCQKLKDADIIPIANSLGDEWDINEVVFMSLAPNFIGGIDGRLAYETGKRPWNDANMVRAFTAMQEMIPFMPKGFEALTYNDAIALFSTGKAAMRFDGSWTLGEFKSAPFKWSVAAVPPPAGKAGYVCFHVDQGIAMNSKSKYSAEAREFLEWLCNKEGVEVASKAAPLGFFPMINNPPAIADKHANDFLQLNSGRGLDVRLPWPKLMAGTPSGYQLMNEGVIKVMTGKETPRVAADNLAKGLATWYKPSN